MHSFPRWPHGTNQLLPTCPIQDPPGPDRKDPSHPCKDPMILLGVEGFSKILKNSCRIFARS